ncbi:hypothetical protein HDV00_010180 [Rhizophlyctis rosea]|nr:hypothetical protein HDV00_010180 [Rhizophlyctis rosea]
MVGNEILEGPRAIMRAKGGIDIASSSEDEAAGSDDEVDYESRPRQVKKEWIQVEEESKRLPVKMEDGRVKVVKHVVEEKKEEPAEPSTSPTTEPDVPIPEAKPSKKKTKKEQPPPQEPKSEHERRIEAQEKLAEAASSVIEDPELHLNSLKTLRDVGKSRDFKIQQLALLSQLAVYKDIIPGYRIRSLTEEEQAVKVSKDVKKLREYEQALLRNYQEFLQVLENTVRAHISEPTPTTTPLLLTALHALTTLLTTHPHFNFRLNLMTAITSRMFLPLSHPLPQIPTLCISSLCTLFANDESGEATLEAVKMIAKGVKERGYKVREGVVRCLLWVKVGDVGKGGADGRVEEEDKGVVGKKRKKEEGNKHVSRKMRKVGKKEREVEKELREAEAVVDREEVKKRQTETLKYIFLTYFRILKSSPTSPLIPAVLEGLARFAHLISVDFFADLLETLKTISEKQFVDVVAGDGDEQDGEGGVSGGGGGGAGRKDRARSAFHCVIAAFQLLSGQGEALTLDLTTFYTSFYAQLLRLPLPSLSLSSVPSRSQTARRESDIKNAPKSDIFNVEGEDKSTSTIELLLKGFELMFWKKKQVPVERVAAFVKRVGMVGVGLGSEGALGVLCMIRSLFIVSIIAFAFGAAHERVLGTGVFSFV